MEVLPGVCTDFAVPDDCFDQAFQIADCLATATLSAVYPFFPDDGGCETIKSFVAFSASGQPDDCCNQISVLIEKISPQGRQKCWTHWFLSYRIEAVFSCYPGITADANGEVYLPSVQAQEAANRWIYAVGFAIAAAVWEAASSPSCPALMAASNIKVGDLMPSGPRGSCAGWNMTVSLDF